MPFKHLGQVKPGNGPGAYPVLDVRGDQGLAAKRFRHKRGLYLLAGGVNASGYGGGAAADDHQVVHVLT